MSMLRDLNLLGIGAMEEVARASRANEATIRMVKIHVTKPWVRGFHGILLSPLRPGLGAYLKEPLAEAEGRIWFFPSTKWWMAHAGSSHPPDGSGCDVQIHQDFLTETGKNAEFLYANVLKDRSLRVLQRPDFETECQWWARYF